MSLKTVRVRRNRPSALSLSLALMITMLVVWAASLSAAPKPAGDAAVAQTIGEAELRMEGMSVSFLIEGWGENEFIANVMAANCAQDGGAGLVLEDAERFAVVREAQMGDVRGEDRLVRRAGGLKLKLSGSSDEIRAISDALGFLYAQARETGSLAAALENGSTDASSVSALMNVYLTQCGRSLMELAQIDGGAFVVERLKAALESAMECLQSAESSPDGGKLRLIHAAGCAKWIELLEEIRRA